MIWLELYILGIVTAYVILFTRMVGHFSRARPFPWKQAAAESLVVLGLSACWLPIALIAIVFYLCFDTRR